MLSVITSVDLFYDLKCIRYSNFAVQKDGSAEPVLYALAFADVFCQVRPSLPYNILYL